MASVRSWVVLRLTTRELSGCRAELDDTLPGTVVLSRLTRTGDGQGGFTASYAASGTVSCRLSPIDNGDEGVVADRVAEVDKWMLTVPAGTDVIETDRAVHAGVTYEIEHVRTRVPWEISRRVVCVEVD